MIDSCRFFVTKGDTPDKTGGLVSQKFTSCCAMYATAEGEPACDSVKTWDVPGCVRACVRACARVCACVPQLCSQPAASGGLPHL